MDKSKKIGVAFKAFTALVVVNFVVNLHHASIAYVNSSFLGHFLSPTAVSIAFSVQAVVIIATLAALPTLVRLTGVRTLLVTLIPVLQFAALLLGFASNPVQALTFFFLQGMTAYSLLYLLDLYVEAVTKDESKTGNVRGIFLTSSNLATFFAPLAIAFFVAGAYFPPLYTFTAVILTVALILALTSMRRLTPVLPKSDSLREALRQLWCCKPSIARVMGANFLLQTFFAWIIVYIPLYLVGEGLSWQAIGFLTAFALLPYLVMEIPLGFAADHWWGETEIMAAGFFVLALATAALSLIPLSFIVLWGLAFFTTRIGASMIEISTESYFFKQINEQDAALVSIFRMMRPLGLLVGPLIALIILPTTGLQYLFVVFGAILLIGVPLSLQIWDTK